MKARDVARFVLTLLFVGIGVTHFTHTDAFVHIMPPYLPLHRELVWTSGFFEILGGVSVQVPRLRRAAGYGLVALLFAVFPANVHMAVTHVPAPDGTPIPSALLWGRLPLQLVLMAWVWWVAIRSDEKGAPSEPVA